MTGDFLRAAAEQGIRLDADCAPGAAPLFADPDLFEQLVVNLVENALRFAHQRIAVRLRGDAGGTYELSVHDDGVGIPPEKKSLLFTRFNQLERTRAPDGYKGTGLGLAICKETVGLHRRPESTWSASPEKRTQFLMRFPAAGGRTPPPIGAARSGAMENGAGK